MNGYVIAGYLITFGALTTYLAVTLRTARRLRRSDSVSPSPRSRRS